MTDSALILQEYVTPTICHQILQEPPIPIPIRMTNNLRVRLYQLLRTKHEVREEKFGVYHLH